MSAADDAFYQNDCVRAMALITKRLALDTNSKIAPHQDAFDAAEATLTALTGAGQVPPADLATKTDEYVQAVKDGYEAAKVAAEANLALPPEVQQALGINPEREQATLDVANQWLFAIDQAWTPGGGN